MANRVPSERLLPKTTLPKRPLLWCLLLSSVPLLGWWSYGLFDLDEGFYAAVVAEMNRRGEWITPFYNGSPWFEKPILLYWAAKPSVALFGEMIGPRFPSVLATVGLYVAVATFCRRHFGLRASILSVLVVASCLLVVASGRMMLTDPLLDLCFAGAMLSFWNSLVGDYRWRILTAGLLGLGVLAKGPVAILLFVPIAGWTYWRQPSLRAGFRGGWLAGTAVLALVVATWYIPAYLVNGHVFVQKFLIEQNVGRFTGGDAAHTLGGPASLALYLPILLVGMAPWSWFVPQAIWRSGAGLGTGSLRQYLAAWAIVVFLFFSLSGAKLPHYILPAVPPLAILVGADLAARWESRPRLALFPVLWLIGLGAFAQWGFWTYYHAKALGSVPMSGQSEVHALCRYVREHAEPGDLVAEYEMGRQQRDLGTGKLKLQETALPSTLLYLDRDVLDTGDWSAILARPQAQWVLTRWNRVLVGGVQWAAAGARIREVRTDVAQDQFRLFWLAPTGTGGLLSLPVARAQDK